MAENLRLRVVLDMAERVLAPMKRIGGASGETARALKAARDRLKELNEQQAAVGNVQKHAAELTRLNNALKVKQNLLAGMKASGTATAAQIKREESGVRKLSEALELQKAAAIKARGALNAMGVTGNLGAAQARLKSEVEQATAAMQKQKAAVNDLARHHRKLGELREKHAKAMLHTGMAAGAGMAMQAAGRRGVEIGMGPVRDYSKHEDAMLGIARQVPGARNEMGQLTEVYRQAERDVRELSGQIPVATTEITAMMTAAARMEVPTGQLKEFTLLASEMATAFDAVPDQVTESMGKVAKNFKIPLTSIRGLADSINYLDDNAMSKGADIIDFLNITSGVVSTVAMKAQDAAALGSTLLTMGERVETASTAANAIVQKFAAATKGTKKFKDAMGELGLTTEEVQKGMSTDAMATMDKIIAAIGKLPSDQRIGVMVELVGLEHSDTLAKLVDKPEELARQRELANGAGAKGSMAREAAARNAALSAQWQMTKNRAFNLGTVVGESLAPALLQLMKAVNPLIDGFGRWVKAHPVLVGWVMKLVIGGAALVAVLGAVLVPLALIAGKAMLVRFLFARLALAMGGQLAGALRLVGAMALNVGRALLFTPIGAFVAGIAVAALLIYKYWQPLAAFFSGIWTGFSNAIAPAFAAIGNALGPLRPALDWLLGVLGGVWNWFAALLAPMQATEGQLQGISNMGQFLGQVLGTLVMGFLSIPQAFYQLGVDIIMGFVNGLTGSLGFLKDAVVGMASSVGGWFAEKLGIASPSKVFMQYGGWISEGAALGISGGQGAVRTAALAMATAATGAMPLAADAAALRMDTRAPLSATAPGAGPGAGGATTISITVNAAPGMDPQAVARAVSAELDRRDRAKRSRVNSSLSDID